MKLSLLPLALALIAGAIAYGRLSQQVTDLQTLLEIRTSHLQSWIDELKSR